MMATIENKINRSGTSSPQSFAQVSVTLSWDTDSSPIARVPSTDTVISGARTTAANADGEWSLDDVVENDLIQPAGSVYKVVETFTDATKQTYYISVPSSATPSYWVGDILAAKPAWES